MNTMKLTPKKNFESNRLKAGILQLTAGITILDHTLQVYSNGSTTHVVLIFCVIFFYCFCCNKASRKFLRTMFVTNYYKGFYHLTHSLTDACRHT